MPFNYQNTEKKNSIKAPYKVVQIKPASVAI